MHNVDVESLLQTVEQAKADPAVLRQPVELSGEWQTAMTFATEAAREGVELRALRGVITTEVDQRRALGVDDRPPVEHVEWRLEVEADAPQQTIDELKEPPAVRAALYATTMAAGALYGARRLRRRYGRPPRRPRSDQAPAPGAVDVGLTAANGRTLRGWFVAVPGADEARPAALVVHGWGGSAAGMTPLAGPLLAAGLHVLLLDARCHGRSDDDEFVSMPRFAEDVESGLTWLRRRDDVDRSRLVLVGHSVGAGACLLVASRDSSVGAVVSIASMAHPGVFMARIIGERLPRPLTTLALRYVERTIGHRFETFAPVRTIGRIEAPVLLLHGDRDTTVPVADAYELHAQAPGRTQLVIVEGAGHTSIGAFIGEIAPAVDEFLRAAGVTAAPDDR